MQEGGVNLEGEENDFFEDDNEDNPDQQVKNGEEFSKIGESNVE